MKKIIFSALLAIVAVGGAMTASAVTYYSATNTVYDCLPAGQTLCNSISQPLWEDENQGGTQITPEDFFENNERYTPQ